jgi:PAS domain S-box-containing protein
MNGRIDDPNPFSQDNGEIEIRSRRSRLWFGLTFLSLIPILLAGLALWFTSEYRRLGSSEDEAQRAHARQLLISELFSATKDAETGQRGFVLTGNDAFLEPYRQSQADVRRLFTELRSYPTSPAEQARLIRIGKLIGIKFKEMERILDVRRSQGLIPAAAAVSGGEGKRVMDQIRAESAAARVVEAQTLTRSLARQNERTRVTLRIIWIAVAFIAAIFLLMGLSFWRNERERAALQRRAAESAARRRAIFDSTLDAIILINPSGSIETINRAATRLFGYADEALIRRDISLLVDLAPGDGPFLDRLGLGPDGITEPFRHSLAANRSDGSKVPVEAALGVMPLPDGIHIVAALRDISEREKAERIKDQFLSTISHELRTPLTSIVGSLGLLRGGASGEMDPGVQRLLVIAENNANRLIRLVNDLLDIEKFESGQMTFDFQPIDLCDAAAKALDAVRGIAQTQNVTLDLSQPPEPVMVRGDAERLVQVFTNLLANAVRFTPAGRKVTLTVVRRTNHAEASVVDEGPGIDAELRSRLFTRFAQSIQAPVGQARGTGLGLAISREIVRNHGGGIWYDPTPGGGSSFSFNLPLWNIVTDQPDNGGAPRVLICASETEAKSIADALENRSILANVVNGPAAIDAALESRPYLALLIDSHCLGDDSRLLERIRSHAENNRLPIIAIAADDGGTAEFSWLDVVDWIPRPLDAARLNAALASVMSRMIDTMPLILHVDDDTDTLEITAAALKDRARMARATDMASARAFLAENKPNVVIFDLALPDGSGEDLLADLAHSGDLATPVIIYSAQERNGAFAREVSAVLTKSKRSLSALVETITGILDGQSEEGGQDGR